jgi:beta-1,4-mannosyltransferase
MRVVAFPAFSNKAVNPYNWLLYTGIQAQAQQVEDFQWSMLLRLHTPDIFHIHWPEYHVLMPTWRPSSLLKFVMLRMYLVATRLRGGKLVWTAHNAFGHDQSRHKLNLILWRRFLRAIDGVIFLSQESKRLISDEYPILKEKRAAVIQHGDYAQWLTGLREESARSGLSRESLGIPPEATVLLSFGQIRRYKGVDSFAAEFSRLHNTNVHLVLAGQAVESEPVARLEALVSQDSRIHCILRRLEDAELAALLGLADVVVLPYRAVMNSGSLLLALSAERRVVAPNLGSLPELQRIVGEDWLRLYDGAISKEHISSAIEWAGGPQAPLNMDEFRWPTIARQTLDFYHALLRARPVSP